MKSLNSFINFRSSRPNLQSSYISLDRWLTVGSPSGLDAKWMLKLVAVLAILLTVGVGQMWGTVLFHETFGSVSGATDWNYATHSTKSGVASVFSGVSSYSITNADKICKYNMGYGTTQDKNNTDGSALYSNQGKTGTLIIGPLNVSDYESLNVTHWVGKSSGGAWDGTNNIMTLKYSTNNSTYTAVSQTGSLPSGAVSNTAVNHNYTQVSYSLPAAAISSTLYLKFEFYVYQLNKSSQKIGQCYIDEVELTGTAAAASCTAPSATSNGSVTLSQTKPSKIDSHLVIISVFQRSFCRMYLLNVLRLQWRLWAMLRLERPDCNALRIYSSFRYNGLSSFLVRLPFGRPICFPSALSLAKASRVRWLIRLRSISADRPKANANTLDCMSSPKR